MFFLVIYKDTSELQALLHEALEKSSDESSRLFQSALNRLDNLTAQVQTKPKQKIIFSHIDFIFKLFVLFVFEYKFTIWFR
jgi:hypothetical protein